MKSPSFKAPPYLIRPQGRRGILRAIALAILVHGILGVFLFAGIRWKTKPPDPVSAELFSPPPATAVAPKTELSVTPEPKPAPKPEPKVEPKPEPKIEPKVEPKPIPKPEPKVEIDTEKKSKKDEKKPDPKKSTKDEPKDEKSRESPKKVSDAKPDTKRDEAKKDDAKKEEASREDYVKSMVAKAAAAEAKTKAGTGTTVGATAPVVTAGTDRGYGAKVASALKANTSFQIPDDMDGSPEAVFLVKLKPDCGIISVEVKKSSGLGSWDQAAERGIRRTNPFPAMSNGLCDASLEIARSPKD
jgi:colicin import membrane protein